MALEMLVIAAALSAGDGCGVCGSRVGSAGVYTAAAAVREEASAIKGRDWHGVSITNGSTKATRLEHAAGVYGEVGESQSLAVVRVDGLFAFEGGLHVTIRPWERIEADNGGNHTTNPYRSAQTKAIERLEQARQEWLKDQGYVGGVRTFRSDEPAAEQRGEIKPRGVIELSPEVTQFKSRMQVQASPTGSAKVTREREVIKVVPAVAREESATPVARAAEGEAKGS